MAPRRSRPGQGRNGADNSGGAGGVSLSAGASGSSRVPGGAGVSGAPEGSGVPGAPGVAGVSGGIGGGAAGTGRLRPARAQAFPLSVPPWAAPPRRSHLPCQPPLSTASSTECCFGRPASPDQPVDCDPAAFAASAAPWPGRAGDAPSPFAPPPSRRCNAAAAAPAAAIPPDQLWQPPLPAPLQRRCRPPQLSATGRDPPLIFSGLDLAIPQAQLAAASGKQPHPVAAPSSSDCSTRPHDQRAARQCQQQRRFASAPPAPMTFAE